MSLAPDIAKFHRKNGDLVDDPVFNEINEAKLSLKINTVFIFKDTFLYLKLKTVFKFKYCI